MPKLCHVESNHVDHIFRLMRECCAARDAGYEVVIIAEGDTGIINGMKFIGFPKEKSRLKRFIIRTKKMVDKAIKEKPDLIQLHSPALLLYALKIKRRGIKVVFDEHDFFILQIRNKYYIPKMLRNAVSWLYEKFETYMCKRIDCVLYPCTINGKNLFENRAKRSLKIENYSMFVSVPSQTKENKTIVYAGCLSEDRGISSLAYAVNEIDGAKLVLCGAFSPESYKKEFYSICENEKVEFHGYLNREELFKVYSKCVIGACLVHQVGQYGQADNLHTKIYEYMQCGIPVIFSDFPYQVMVNEKYHFGIAVDPRDNTQIKNAIEYLFSHPDEAEEMGKNGIQAVKNEFNWTVESKKLIDLYNEFLR